MWRRRPFPFGAVATVAACREEAGWVMMLAMKTLFSFKLTGKAPADAEPLPAAASDSVAQVFPAFAPRLTVASTIHPVAAASLARLRDRLRDADDQETDTPHGTLLRTFGWVSAGVGAVALGLLVGRELRGRYKFIRRTPYDFYAHAGDERELEFGVGI